MLVRPVGEAAVQTSVTHSAGGQTLPVATPELPRRAEGRGRAAELLIRLVGTVRVAVAPQSQVETRAAAGSGRSGHDRKRF